MWLQEIGEESFWKVEIELLLGMAISLRSKKEGLGVCGGGEDGALGRGQCTCCLKRGKAVHYWPPPSPLLPRPVGRLIF